MPSAREIFVYASFVFAALFASVAPIAAVVCFARVETASPAVQIAN